MKKFYFTKEQIEEYYNSSLSPTEYLEYLIDRNKDFLWIHFRHIDDPFLCFLKDKNDRIHRFTTSDIRSSLIEFDFKYCNVFFRGVYDGYDRELVHLNELKRISYGVVLLYNQITSFTKKYTAQNAWPSGFDIWRYQNKIGKEKFSKKDNLFFALYKGILHSRINP